MKIKFIKGSESEATCNHVTTLQVLAECDGVKRMVQGFTDEAGRDAIAKSIFADVIESGAPAPVVKPTHDDKWASEIDAVAVKAAEIR